MLTFQCRSKYFWSKIGQLFQSNAGFCEAKRAWVWNLSQTTFLNIPTDKLINKFLIITINGYYSLIFIDSIFCILHCSFIFVVQLFSNSPLLVCWGAFYSNYKYKTNLSFACLSMSHKFLRQEKIYWKNRYLKNHVLKLFLTLVLSV